MNRIALLFVFAVSLFSEPVISQDISDSIYTSDGRASYYAKKFHGRKTANGEIFNNYDYTAAHRKLPFDTYLNVINKSNNYNIIVRVNDRGPYTKNRIIDLSEAAARRIGGYNKGLVQVKIEILNLLKHTPELDSMYNAAPVVDCFGNIAELNNISLSLWSTTDLLHAIYVANDLYLKEKENGIFIGKKSVNGKKKYHIVVTGIENKSAAEKIKIEYELKGFMKVINYVP